MTASVVLILGAGPRIGSAVAERFASLNYKVAIAARKAIDGTNEHGYLSLKADLTVPDSIPALFEKVVAEFQAAPSIVIYNAASLTPPPDDDSALSIPVERFQSDINVNTVSAYKAAQEAVQAWASLPHDMKKTFIYTGNILNVSVLPIPMLLNLGVGKAASAYWIGLADAAYKGKGYRFFYADERTEEGELKGQAVDEVAHANFYEQLATQSEEVPWHATFTKGKGYAKF